MSFLSSLGPGSSSLLDNLSRGNILSLITDCLPLESERSYYPQQQPNPINISSSKPRPEKKTHHAFAISGTGNGDSFLRLSACRTAVAISRFSSLPGQDSLSRIAGPGGELEQSAGDRWGKTGEGEGGMIGIELVGSEGNVVMNFNCGGMFRAWVDGEGGLRCRVFRGEY